MYKTTIKQRIFLVILGLLLFIILLELGLRLGGFILLSIQEYRNRLSLNQKGIYRILCLGESTTASGGIYSYPSQLQEILNEKNIGISFSVINKGVYGFVSSAIVASLGYNLDKYKPNMVITMMGINDGEGNIPYIEALAKTTTPLFKTFRIYKLASLLRLHIINKAEEIRIYKPQQKKETITFKTDDLTQPASYREREEMYKKAIQINPENYWAYIELGRHYRKQGQFLKAEEILKKAIQINPEDYWAYLELGRCYRKQKQYANAEEILKKAIQINPENYWAYVFLGRCYADQGRYSRAEEMFRKAAEANLREDLEYVGLALLYALQGEHRLTQGNFKKANSLGLEYYNLQTRYSYQRLKEILDSRGIQLVCSQYPVRSIEPLKNMFEHKGGIIFVDNEKIFKMAVKQSGYDEYFTDNFAGDFGHCTPKGNRLLAENIANTILREHFKINTD